MKVSLKFEHESDLEKTQISDALTESQIEIVIVNLGVNSYMILAVKW